MLLLWSRRLADIRCRLSEQSESRIRAGARDLSSWSTHVRLIPIVSIKLTEEVYETQTLSYNICGCDATFQYQVRQLDRTCVWSGLSSQMCE